MSGAAYREVDVSTDGLSLRMRVTLENCSAETWPEQTFFLGWQFFDPETKRFILEGEWVPLEHDVAPGSSAAFDFSIAFPPEAGGYQIYVSPIQQPGSWAWDPLESTCRHASLSIL